LSSPIVGRSVAPLRFKVQYLTTREQGMRNRKAAEVKADVEARIAQIEQMTLEQIGCFSAEY
jgi:hypothetical protein